MSTAAIVYDLETKRTFAEVAGSSNKFRQLEISFLGVYSYSQNRFFSFFEADLPKLEQIITIEQPTIIGFNTIRFDNLVLQPYFPKLQLASLPQVDILDDIHRTLGFRIKLESVAQATLGEGKSGTGLDAIRYYRESNWTSLQKYCLEDVRITRDIYEYGCRHGYILYTSGGDCYRMPVHWSDQPTIAQQLQTAWEQHQRITITYLNLTEQKRSVVTTSADILGYDQTGVEAYAYAFDRKVFYTFDRILSITVSETNRSAYQATLFS